MAVAPTVPRASCACLEWSLDAASHAHTGVRVRVARSRTCFGHVTPGTPVPSPHMAAVEECEQAFHDLAAKLAAADDSAKQQASLNRSISCKLRDLNVIFFGRLKDGELLDIRQVDRTDAQVRLSMTSDVLLDLTSGRRSFASAWLGGAVTVDANIFDLLKLRSIL